MKMFGYMPLWSWLNGIVEFVLQPSDKGNYYYKNTRTAQITYTFGIWLGGANNKGKGVALRFCE